MSDRPLCTERFTVADGVMRGQRLYCSRVASYQTPDGKKLYCGQHAKRAVGVRHTLVKIPRQLPKLSDIIDARD